MLKEVAAAVLVCVILSPATANADRLRVSDPNDVPGRLDILSVAHGHGSRQGLVTHSVRVARGFPSRLLKRNGAFELFFSGQPGGCVSTHILIDSTNDGTRARMRFVDPLGCGSFDDSGGSTQYQPIDAIVTRPNQRTMKIKLNRKLLPGRGDYGWYAETRFRKRSTRCERACVDQVPNEGGPRGRVAHEL